MTPSVSTKQFQYGEIKSFWGAVAAILLWQSYGIVLLQAFRTYLELYEGGISSIESPNSLGVLSGEFTVDQLAIGLWISFWFVIFVFAHADAINRGRHYLVENAFKKTIFNLTRVTELLRLIAALLFLAVYKLLLDGYYPFPYIPVSTFHSVLFSVFSLLLCFGIGLVMETALVSKWRAYLFKQSPAPTTTSWFVHILAGVIFTAGGYFFGEVISPIWFYLFGMVGLGIFVGTVSALLFNPDLLSTKDA